jgi:hypothetical protein
VLGADGGVATRPAAPIGALLGYLVTRTYATTQKWPTVVPLWVLAGGVGATVLIGAIAGLYRCPWRRGGRP